MPAIADRPRSLALVLALLAWACSTEDTATKAPEPVSPAPTARSVAPRGTTFAVDIQEMLGATGPGGRFAPGDIIEVIFRVDGPGGPLRSLDTMTDGGILVSGPTENHHRVIALQDDLRTATALGRGRFRYRFPLPMPERYLAPINDGPEVDQTDGEFERALLRSGTYTVGLELSAGDPDAPPMIGNATRDFLVAGTEVRDASGVRRAHAGRATAGVLEADGPGIEPREVVTLANCDQCHGRFAAHDGRRRSVELCGLCHTTGSQDWNADRPESLDFRVMIHRIHAGADLPSAQGVTTDPQGDRLYGATPRALVYTGPDGQTHDFSQVRFPRRMGPLPRDIGYAELSDEAQAADDRVRAGPSQCAACHGDPDGAGPAPAPAQGALAFAQPSREACGGCHDDVVWTRPYRANDQLMPEQLDDSACLDCHAPTAAGVARLTHEDALTRSTRAAHRHPLADRSVNPGLRFHLLGVEEAGVNDGDGRIEPGEKPALMVRITDSAGRSVGGPALAGVEVVIAGPRESPQVLLHARVDPADLRGGNPFRIKPPMQVSHERTGATDGTADQTLYTRHSPHRGETIVRIQTGAGTATVLAQDVPAGADTVLLADDPMVAEGELVEIGVGDPDGELREVARVAGLRLWFTAPLLHPRLTGAAVRGVQVETLAESAYTRAPAGGRLTLTGARRGGQAVIVSYTTDYVVPATYPPPLGDSPDLGEGSGEWTGKALVDGIYTAGIWGYRQLAVDVGGEVTTYRAASRAATAVFAIGEGDRRRAPPEFIDSASCANCHGELRAHGGTRRGYDACVLCHRASGIEDTPLHRRADAAETPGTTVDFRSLIHQIHRPEADLTVAGFRSDHHYTGVAFPHQPNGIRDCGVCHGATDWQAPAPRRHPTEAGLPPRIWLPVCGSCHDSARATRHMQDRLPADRVPEPCGRCHGPESAVLPVAVAHGAVSALAAPPIVDAGPDAAPVDAAPPDMEPADMAVVDAGADGGDAGPDMAAPRCGGDGTAPTWEVDILPILEASCNGCHSDPPCCDARSALTTYEALFEPAPDQPDILLFESVANRVQGIGPIMPVDGPLPLDQVEAVRLWAEAGAPLCDAD